MRSTLILLLMLCAAKINAQSHFTRILNQDTTGSYYISYGLFNRIQSTTDGGHLLQYYIGSNTSEGGVYDNIIMVKTDSNFLPQWQKHRGSEAIAIKNGSIFSFSNGLYYDTAGCTMLEKMDMQGNVVWSKLLCKNDTSNLRVQFPVYANAKIRLSGFYQFFGDTHPMPVPVFVDIDTLGNFISADTVAGDTSSFEHMYTDDSGNYYLILGGLFNNASRSISKLRPDNSIAWSYVLPPHLCDIASMVTLPNGDVIFGGNYRMGLDSVRIFLMKLSAAGTLLWQRTANRQCRMSDMELTANGDIIIAAGGVPVIAFNLLSEDDIISIDTASHVKWARNIAPNRTVWPFYLGLSTPYIGKNNDLYFAAVTQSPYAATVFSTDSVGVGVCTATAVSFSFHDTALLTLTPGTLNFAPISFTVSNYPVLDSVHAQLYIDSCDYAVPVEVPLVPLPKNAEIYIYPNPASGTLFIANNADVEEVEIFDIAGKSVRKLYGIACHHEIDITTLINGYYIIRITDKHNTQSYKKLVVLN